MPALPPSSDFTGTITEDQFKTAITALRGFLAGTVGTLGTPADALAILGALGGIYAAKTATYTVTLADRGEVIDASGGPWTLNLPTVASAGAGFAFICRNSGASPITIDPAGSELVEGATVLGLSPGKVLMLVCTGAAWIAIQMAAPAFDSTFYRPVRIGSGNSFGDMYLNGNQATAIPVGGSTTAAIISTFGTSSDSRHVGIEVPANDAADGFYIATDANFDGVVDTLAAKWRADGFATTLQVLDEGFVIADNVDKTKTVKFQVAGLTTGTLRTINIPDAGGIMVLDSAAQTLTNKTISGGSLDGAPIGGTTPAAVRGTGLTSTGVITDGVNPHAAGTLALAFATRGVALVTPNASGTFTSTVPPAGTRCDLIITTSGATSYTMTFGTGFVAAGTLATGTVTAKRFVVCFISDGTALIETSRTAAL